MENCPSRDKDGTKCGFPKGHYGKCGNGLGHKAWGYNVPTPAVDESFREIKETTKGK